MGSCCCCCCCFSFLEPDNPVRATTSRFLSARSFLCYKLLAAAYFVFWSFFWPVEENIDDAFKFVTYWEWYTATIYFLVSLCTACMFYDAPRASAGPVRGTHAVGHHYAGEPLSNCRRALLGFQIFMWNIACIGSLVVVAVFWSVLYDGERVSTTDVNAHAIIAVVMAIDQLLVATKFERKQMFASFAFSVTYVAFNVVWFLAAPKDERVIYSVMDWGESIGNSAATALIIIFVLVPISGAIHYWVFRLREHIYKTCGKGSDSSYPKDIEMGGVVSAIYSRTFVLYKSVMAVFFLFWGVWWAEYDKEPEFGAKLTFWTWYTTTAYFCLSSASAYLCWRAIGNGTLSNSSVAVATTATNKWSTVPVPRLLERVQLVAWNVACVASLIVVTLYWLADYDGSAVGSLDILAHSLIALIMVADQMLVADEYKMRHVIFTQIYGVVYVTFNLLWFCYAPEKDRLLYDVMDWKRKTLVACVYGIVCILILAPLFSLLHLYIYRHREKIHQNCQGRLIATNTQSPAEEHEPLGHQSRA
eukprot:g5753.t1